MNGRSLKSAPPTSVRRERLRDAHRALILEAAEEAFATHGYHAASIAEIARQSGFATGTIYLYYDDKSDLYGSIILGKMRELVGRLGQALGRGGSVSDCLLAGAQVQFAFHETNRRFFEIFLSQRQIESSPLHPAHWKELEALKRQVLASITTCIKRGQKERVIRPGEPRRYGIVFLGMVLQMIRQWVRDEDPASLADHAQFIVECFLHGSATPSMKRQRRSTL